MLWFLRRHGPWISSVAIGLLLVAAGTFFIVKGASTRNELRNQLAAEQIITSSTASIPGVLVQDAATAQSQADLIKEHTLGTWGPYSSLDRDDPRRASFIDGVTLRTSLNLAVMGFGLTDMAIGAGILVLIAGAATVLLAAPGLYLLAGMVVPKRQRESSA